MPSRLQINQGDVFGTLTVLSELPSTIENGITIRKFICSCTCGNQSEIKITNLVRVKKCSNRRAHGVSHLKLHSVWRGMKSRCYSTKCKAFQRYGGRGIIICKEWLDDFNSFYNWAINNGYAPGLDIDRKDNSGNYCPENCRFVTRIVNENNLDRTIMVVYRGEEIPFSLLLRNKGLHSKYTTYLGRLNRGWPIEKVIEKQVA